MTRILYAICYNNQVIGYRCNNCNRQSLPVMYLVTDTVRDVNSTLCDKCINIDDCVYECYIDVKWSNSGIYRVIITTIRAAEYQMTLHKNLHDMVESTIQEHICPQKL